MKESMFTISIDHLETNEVILFNTLYGSFTVWGKDEFHAVKRLLENHDSAKEGCWETETIKAQLLKNKYLIDDDIDEISIIKNRKTRGMRDNNRLDVIIMPNMNCNFACPYCYETHNASALMDDKTEEAINKWLETEVPKFKVILLNWFGGEPLLSYDRIVSIARFAIEVCHKHGVECLSNITTNGYLLNEARAKELIGLDIRSYQITVDGPPEIHNKTRVLNGGGDSFARIFENINMLINTDKRVKVSLRVNFNHNNIHTIPDLLDMFPLDVRPNLRIVYEPVFGKGCLSATENISHQEISKTMTKYYQLAQQRGYDVVLEGVRPGKLTYCYAERENQMILNYNGDVYKCSVCDFKPEERVGYLSHEGKIVYDEKEVKKWTGTDLFEEGCYSCKYLPMCMGGCKKMRIEKGNVGSYCYLVPTNTSFALKAVALHGFDAALQDEYKKDMVLTNQNERG